MRDAGTAPEDGSIADLVADNDLQLAELARFLSGMAPGAYARTNGEDAAIGQHVRHILDHYDCLLGAADGRVDYTQRAREQVVACCLETAISRIDAIRQRIARLPGPEGKLLTSRCAGSRPGPNAGPNAGLPDDRRPELRMEVTFTPTRADPDPPRRRLGSTLERELMFVLSHTIHHMALIAVLVRREGSAPIPSGFGVAPSTRRYASQG